MSLHVDVFFVKDGPKLKKHVYFTALDRSDQDMKDVLCLGENVLSEFRKDEMVINKRFLKSDNAGCYHASQTLEIMKVICEEKGFELLRYDFNEPCKGKDQCDRESAAAKRVIRSFLDAGNDINTAKDIFDGMHYGRGLQEAKVCVAEIEAQITSINATKISNFTKYHSISFHNDHMTMWRYYDIGKGVRFDYKGVQFKSGLRLINPFSKTCKETINKCSKKVKNDHSKLDFIFCSELTCSFTTNEEAELEKHMLVGDHLVPKENKVMDKVKKIIYFKNKRDFSCMCINENG